MPFSSILHASYVVLNLSSTVLSSLFFLDSMLVVFDVLVLRVDAVR
jgi:hypothetical protein